MIRRFGDFELDLERFELREAGAVVHVEPQVFDVLVYLTDNTGRVVTKEELLDEVWGTRFVTESTLTSRIKAARRAVGDSGASQSIIKTVRGRGFRFAASVTESDQDADRSVPAAESDRSSAESRAPATPVPIGSGPLFGREREVGALTRLLSHSRLVSILGPGGLGKTRLALDVAAKWRDEQGVRAVFVDLTAVEHTDQVIPAIRRALGIRTEADDDVEMLSAEPHLLLIDNFEQVVDAAPSIAELLSMVHDLRILVTSRERLRVAAERSFMLDPLSWEPSDVGPGSAVRLFEDAAQRSSPDFVIDDTDLPTVVEICRLVGGLPLAIELVAAHARLLPIDQLEEQLDGVLDIGTSTLRDGTERHRTMQRTIDWSYRSLSPIERELLERMAVFRFAPSWIDVLGVASGDEQTVAGALASLDDKSFVRSRRIEGTPRFVMPVLIRRFALDEATRAGTIHDAEDRHAFHIQALVVDAENERWHADTDGWFLALSDWWDDIDDALTFDFGIGDPVRGAATVARLYATRLRRADIGVAETWTARAMEYVDELGPIDGGLLHIGAGYLSFLRHDTATAHEHFRRALDEFEKSGNRRYVALATVDVAGTALGGTTSLDASIARCLRGVELSREVGEPTLVAHAVNVLGELYRYSGANESARLAYEEALELARSQGDRSHAVVVQINLAALAIEADDVAAADGLAREALRRAGEIRAKHLVASGLAVVADVLVRRGDPESAARVLGASDAALRALGASRGPSERPADERLRDRLALALGTERAHELIAEGGSLSLDEAVALSTAR